MIHELKVWPNYFERLLDGSKTFEIRKDDRGFQTGDVLVLKEWDPKGDHDYCSEDRCSGRRYSGREISAPRRLRRQGRTVRAATRRARRPLARPRGAGVTRKSFAEQVKDKPAGSVPTRAPTARCTTTSPASRKATRSDAAVSTCASPPASTSAPVARREPRPGTRMTSGRCRMASKRKLWKTVAVGWMERRPESQAAAYRYVNARRADYQAGMLRYSQVTVYVDERDGRGWRTYEHLNFAAEVPDAG